VAFEIIRGQAQVFKYFYPEESYESRVFSFYSDQRIKEVVTGFFEILDIGFMKTTEKVLIIRREYF